MKNKTRDGEETSGVCRYQAKLDEIVCISPVIIRLPTILRDHDDQNYKMCVLFCVQTCTFVIWCDSMIIVQRVRNGRV